MRHEPRPIMVAFVGASGVGKSYLLARVGEALLQRGAQLHDLDAVRTRKFNLANVLLVLKAAYLVRLTRQKSLHHYPELVKRLAQDMIRQRALASGASGIYLCSEGVLEDISSGRCTGLSSRAHGGAQHLTVQ